MKRVIIHGGCGAREDKHTTFEEYHNQLLPIIQQVADHLNKTNNAIDSALFAASLLEDNPMFNAGTGSRVQQDGQIRMSAAYIDSVSNKFAAVINVQDVRYPSKIAYALHKKHHSILAGEPATQFAHQELLIPPYNPLTESRWQEYLDARKGKTGTVGVVTLDDEGVICALTSTGGVGFESPGRVGDSPTVAGNYASKVMGVACTGIGEEIVNKAVAAKIHTRVQDGMSLQKAVDKSIAESDQDNDYVGLIALDSLGNICTGKTKVAETLYAYYDGSEFKTFLSDLQ